MERLTERCGKQVLYLKDGETFPYTLMSGYDVQRVLERLCELEDAVESRCADETE